jgi:hypothetical protein
MKIRLTENQYKRLLKEDDSDFLDGNVNFRNIGNKIDKPIAKLFCNLMKNDKYLPNGMTTENLKSGEPSNNSQFSIIKNRIMELGGYTHSESILLLYNYIKLYEEFDLGSNNLMIGCDKLIGTPLEFYGKFSHYANIQHTAYVSGWSTGSGEFYTTSYDDFIDKWENGEVEIIDTDDNIDYECYNLHWETDWDSTYDNLDRYDFDEDNINVDIG